jgi:hypothetical protein
MSCHNNEPVMIPLQGQEPKMKTISEKKWDWKLQNETKPLWVSRADLLPVEGVSCAFLYLMGKGQCDSFTV